MPWLKTDDVSGMHPYVLEVDSFDDDDEDLINRVYGFVSRAAVMSAQYMLDYFVTDGVLRTLASRHRYRENLAAAQKAGLLGPAQIILDEKTGREVKGYFIIQEEGLWHIRTREEIEWERQRKRDNGNGDLSRQIRLRDGDACRYCDAAVDFSIRKGARSGTYDHIIPKGPGTLENMVVSCRACNSKKKDADPAIWQKKLSPEPEKPFYRPATLEWLKEAGLMPASGAAPLGAVHGDRSRERPAGPGARAAEPRTGDRLAAENSPRNARPARPRGLESSQEHPDQVPLLEDSPADRHDVTSSERTRTPVADSHEEEEAAEPRTGDRLHAANSQPRDRDWPAGPQPQDSLPRDRHRTDQIWDRPVSNQDPESLTSVSGFTGSGLDWSGRVGPGRAGAEGAEAPAGAEVPSAPARRKRRRRSRRPKTQRREEA